MRFVCEEIKAAIKQHRQVGGRLRQITMGRRLVPDFLRNLQFDYKFTNLSHVKIGNAVICSNANHPQPAIDCLAKMKIDRYRGIPFQIVDGDQLTME